MIFHKSVAQKRRDVKQHLKSMSRKCRGKRPNTKVAQVFLQLELYSALTEDHLKTGLIMQTWLKVGLNKILIFYVHRGQRRMYINAQIDSSMNYSE